MRGPHLCISDACFLQMSPITMVNHQAPPATVKTADTGMGQSPRVRKNVGSKHLVEGCYEVTPPSLCALFMTIYSQANTAG